ncbi:MAG: putative 4-hydroxybenzoate polyprenyltransferase [Firmicutes bacterium]|nr:putative 4-hydroxybenzoate polyprenyltransferase [Bacillota bacterium]
MFALPFAYIGAMLSGIDISPVKWLFITLAMVGARTAAMSLNRLIDLKYDRANPRTADRTLPKGKMRLSTVVLIIIASLGLLVFSAYSLNYLCLILSPIAVLLLVLYSYLKRFTYLCHIVLGSILGCAPVGGWIAMTGRIALPPVLLGIAVMFWSAGFDIIYACQDYQFDIDRKLHSIPVKFGLKQALRISYFFHIMTLTLIIFTGLLLGQNFVFYTGVIIVGALLAYEHVLVKPDEINNINKAF